MEKETREERRLTVAIRLLRSDFSLFFYKATTRLTQQDQYSISCVDEGGLHLSNSHEEEMWNSIQKLLELLVRETQFSSMQTLFAWKENKGHRASAREAYAWRGAIEEIKNNDLMKVTSSLKPEEVTLIADKPAMLKMAGEITNALLHSYGKMHLIRFGTQKDSNVPS